ncbi:cytochrome b [Legionella taurinensis]|uniref:Cytochrome B n=1 Tax=Legionella taurinensis TaxID=70611 RepID=A0A3A5LEQ5_9GAMM|nr:cytochrome b [Legionella taurinensis]MDX1836773.1 cytochrome b [Legionella taurinensis]PUT41194.1 cytochrome B [Legionella taurinensis]PUT42319.1 cytochrome B [Legionella taurinensis]PUT43844.1 cytochrome B [Legionella taurinensis]PUT47100.1 cytochrome B [Legionella taurinensis]
MRIRNDDTHFGLAAIGLHWAMAVLIIGLLILGFFMVSLPVSLQKLKLYGWHKEYGFLALFLVAARLLWRLSNPTPRLNLARWEVISARSVHWLFYAMMLLMPLTGWLITSAAGLPASFFGWFTLPNLTGPDEQLRQVFEQAHEWLAYVLIGLIALHAAAALKHYFINKDDILQRMISP